ncbi:MAG: DPP IV N-terminal domain-containing protein [Muribaculaceae bacterium]|nr:DPP IV N-terminal domain-containing protein [Muribaculaceae bacterium]
MKRFASLMMMAIAVVTSHALSLQDFVLSQSRPATIGEVRPATDGRYYYQLDGPAINRVEYKSGRAKVVLSEDMMPDTIAGWDGYEMSRDENVILLWARSEPIYRHSFRAEYFTYDRRQGRLTAVCPGRLIEIATLSGSGRRVAYVSDGNIFLHSLDGGQDVQVTTDGLKNHVINGVPDWVYQEEFGMLNSICWSDDESEFSFLRWDESLVPMYSMTLYEGDCHPNSEYALYPGSFDYKYPVAGEKNSVVTAKTYHLADGTLTTAGVEADYIAQLAYMGHDLMVTTLNRAQNRMDIIRARDGAVLYHEESDTWIEESSATGTRFYDDCMVVKSEQSGHMQLYLVDDKANCKQLTAEAENVTSFYGRDTNHRYYYQCTAGPLNRAVKCVDLGGRVTALTPTRGTYSAQFNADFTHYVQTFSDATTPTQYRLMTTGGKTVRDLELNKDYAKTYTSAEVPRREFFGVQSQGVTLNGYMIKPLDFDPGKKYPVIMSQYSGPGSQSVLNKWKLDWEEYFATQGFVVVCVDGRGTGGREREFKTIVYRNLGHYETIDQLAAAREMAKQPWVDSKRIGIWGWSYGGYEVLMAMSHPAATYAAGVSIAPVTSWRFYDTIYAERFMRTPQENADGYERSAPLSHVDDLKGQLLMMFGSADDNVHIINEMQYLARLHGAGHMPELMVYPNMNHSINGCDIRYPLYRRVLDFFNRHLKD